MASDKQDKKQQMTAIVSVFLAIIIVAWIMSLNFTLFNANKESGDGSVQSLLSNFEKSLESFNEELSNNDVDLNNVIISLKDKLNEKGRGVEDLTRAMKEKLDYVKMETWLDYTDENISFKYPKDWVLLSENNIITLSSNDNVYLTIHKYSLEELPDNINSLSLMKYLDEQVNRALGNINGYSAIETGNELEIYEVYFKENVNFAKTYWEKNNIVYSLEHELNEELDPIIKLIIANIK